MSTMTDNVLPPPTERYSVLRWLKKNLFNDVLSSLVSIGMLVLIYLTAKGILHWALTEARWEAILINLRLFMVGQYPVAEMTRVWVCLLGVGLLIGLSWGIWIGGLGLESLVMFGFPFALALLPFDLTTRLWWAGMGVCALIGLGLGWKFAAKLGKVTLAGWMLFFPAVIVILRGLAPEGQPFGLISTNLWGGLLLTFLLSWVSAILSFPMGVLLAIGRQSKFPAVRSFCIMYIELIRAVPLITVLFMAQVLLPLFLPAGMTVDRIVRAMAGITLFTAAYMAEIVRGGLQAIPKGQGEAASALGMSETQKMTLIILPQALRSVIPVIIDQYIGMFRDTTLVLIVGLFDLLGISRAILAQPETQGAHIEVYVFVAVIYWVFSYLMSYIGLRLEVRSGAHARR